jgi:hypothetical protein
MDEPDLGAAPIAEPDFVELPTAGFRQWALHEGITLPSTLNLRGLDLCAEGPVGSAGASDPSERTAILVGSRARTQEWPKRVELMLGRAGYVFTAPEICVYAVREDVQGHRCYLAAARGKVGLIVLGAPDVVRLARGHADDLAAEVVAQLPDLALDLPGPGAGDGDRAEPGCADRLAELVQRQGEAAARGFVAAARWSAGQTRLGALTAHWYELGQGCVLKTMEGGHEVYQRATRDTLALAVDAVLDSARRG